MFTKRLITGLILVGLLFVALAYMPTDILDCFFILIILLGAWEWANLVGLNLIWQRLSYCVLIGMITSLLWMLEPSILPILVLSLITWVILSFFIVSYPEHRVWNKTYIVMIMGIFVLTPAWLGVTTVRQEYGANTLIAMLFLIWAADTGAYFTGKLLGKHKLIPLVSPGKTIEGVIGGVCCGVFFMSLAAYLSEVRVVNWGLLIIIGICGALYSVIGDLLISMLKRERNLKDSGNCLPGHGGLLDRIDSLMAVSPCFLFCVKVFAPIVP